MSRSEVARLRTQIAEELEAMRQGMSGLAWGSARHEIISHKYNALGDYQDQLEHLVGEQKAKGMMVNLYKEIIG